MGPNDYSWLALYKHFKPQYYVRGILAHPGRSTSAMVVKEKIVINLPGLPQSTLSGTLFLLLPVINYLRGLEACVKLPYIWAKAMEKTVFTKYSSFYKLRFVTLDLEKGACKIIEPTDSYFVKTMADADGITILPPGKSVVEKGEELRILFPEPIYRFPNTTVIP